MLCPQGQDHTWVRLRALTHTPYLSFGDREGRYDQLQCSDVPSLSWVTSLFPRFSTLSSTSALLTHDSLDRLGDLATVSE